LIFASFEFRIASVSLLVNSHRELVAFSDLQVSIFSDSVFLAAGQISRSPAGSPVFGLFRLVRFFLAELAHRSAASGSRS
jgi:hypothetical protein